MAKTFLMRFPLGGVNQSLNQSLLPPAQVADAVNCVIEDSMIGCRPGVVIHDLELPDECAVQGAIYFNPAEGQSQQVFSDEAASLILAAGGMKYQVKMTDDITALSKVTMEDVTGDGLTTNPVYHMVWMIQAENYVIAQDGNSQVWIWDGTTDPFFSTGYDTSDQEESKLANGASFSAYAHGRVVQTVGSNRILVGDIIHKDDISSASNILGTTEQVYYATGAFFSPPSNMGEIQSLALLPLQNTQHGHADLIIHCKNGVFSLDISKYPRTEWVNSSISKHVLLDTGAAGFYAVEAYDGDQLFLSRHGVQSLRSEASVNSIGDAFVPISELVKDYIESDDYRALSFASMSKRVIDRRMFVTNQHDIIDGAHRGGRGILTINFQPQSDSNFYSWEGLWTLPGEAYLVNQMTRGIFGNTERNFAFTTGQDKKVRLVEFSSGMEYDQLADGTLKPIEWQVMTRADTLGDETSFKVINNGVITWRNVRGEVKFEVYGRSDRSDWQLWDEGCLNPGDECCLNPASVKDFRFNIGAPPEELKKCLWSQVLIKASGPGFIESIRLNATMDNGGDTRTSGSNCQLLAETSQCDQVFNPFEYSES